MKDKKILPYLPARLVKGDDRWYILYYQTDPSTGILKRFRPTYNLNRIQDVKDRTKLGNHLVKKINKQLPDGFPFYDSEEPKNFSISKALDFFEENKYPAICPDAARAYKRLVIDIREFIDYKKLGRCRISEMNTLHGLGIMKFIWDKRELGNNSYNRYLKDAIVLFNFLKKFKFIEHNIFSEIKPKKKEASRYKKITDQDKRVIAKYLKEHDYQLFLIVQLIHGCFIRPIELTRLKFSYFNLANSTITLPSHITKNGKKRTVTIPDDRIKYFRNKTFASHHAHLYVFGYALKPSDIQSSKERMNIRHRKHLKKMLEKKLLVSLEGYSIYSWKKTGVSNAYRAGIDGEFIRQQCDHTTEKVTQIYNDVDQINLGMKAFNDSLEIE